MTKVGVDRLGVWQKGLAVALGVITLLGLAWANLAEPRIDSKINCKLKPVEDALEYQNYLMMADMPDSTVQKAERMYLQSRKARGR